MDSREVVCDEVCQVCWEDLEFCQCNKDGDETDEVLNNRDYDLDPEPGSLPADPLQGSEPVKTKRKGRKSW